MQVSSGPFICALKSLFLRSCDPLGFYEAFLLNIVLMESENTVRKIHTRGVNRKKLSEITNSPVLCNVQLQDEDFGMFNEAQLQKVFPINTLSRTSFHA